MSEVKFDEQRMYDSLKITADLQGEFERFPTDFAGWAVLVARANDEVRQAEAAVDVLYYELYNDAQEEYGYSAKENQCKAFIHESEEYREAKRKLNVAKAARDNLTAAKESMAHKASMLQQLGPLARLELGATISSRGPRQQQQRPRATAPGYAVEDANDVIMRAARKRKKRQNG